MADTLFSTDALLSVRNLQTSFTTQSGCIRAVDGVSFDIQRGETFAVLGESGCGKSITALSLMRLLPDVGSVTGGHVLFKGQDLLPLSDSKMRDVRGCHLAMIFQEPMTSLNPVLTVGQQIGESLHRHKGLKGTAARARIIELLDSVGIPVPASRIDEYPHQLSGGMKQRVMIAIALAGEPELLIADEPTTALDVTIQAQVLALLKDIQQRTGMAILLITHDLGVVSEVADKVAVMYAGQIVEQAGRDEFFTAPKHPYSQKLFQSMPSMAKRDQALDIIPGTVPPLSTHFKGCRFENRCQYVQRLCRDEPPQWTDANPLHGVRCHFHDVNRAHDEKGSSVELVGQSVGDAELLRVENLTLHFPVNGSLFQRKREVVHAVDGLSLSVKPGQTLALVGESGCGKTTVGKGILQLIRPTCGEVYFEGELVTGLTGEALRLKRKDFQFIFQDPFSSMNPRMNVVDIIAEGMVAQNMGDAASRHQRVAELLQRVGLSAEMADRYPHEFSGGQRQRLCIARALAVNPKLIVCDEPTSALDVSVQAQILNLLKELQRELNISYLFITHNISVVGYLADEVAVMYLGRIVERGTVEDVLVRPQHPYTQALLAAVPTINATECQQVARLEGDMPSPIQPPNGCHFHPRCAKVLPECRQRYPSMVELSSTHQVHCHLCTH